MGRRNFYRTLGFVSLLALAFTPARAESLESRINTLLASDQLKGASVGISVVEVKPGAVPAELYRHNAELPLGPASNCKILTTAAAFEKYGPKAAFKTNLYKIGDDLVIVGGGDPGLGDAKLASDKKTTTAFEDWAQKLKAAGITQFHDLLVDDRVFDNQWIHPNWPADQRLDWYSAPVGGLNFNANCLDWFPRIAGKGVSIELIPNTTYINVTIKATRGADTRVSLLRPAESNHFEMHGTVSTAGGSKEGEPYCVPIYDPGLWTATILRDILASNGIKQTGAVRRVADQEQLGKGALLATNETPLLSVLARANKNSVNMMAECLCKRLGHDATGQPGSWDNGTAAVTAYVLSTGAQPAWVTLDDGSGLSNKNRIAPRAFTSVLAHVAARPDGDSYVATFAQPGEDGTLRKRFKGLSVANSIHAKTGHISGVSTLSGYIIVGERKFAFSILCNKYQGNVNPWQDQVCQAIYDWATK